MIDDDALAANETLHQLYELSIRELRGDAARYNEPDYTVIIGKPSRTIVHRSNPLGAGQTSHLLADQLPVVFNNRVIPRRDAPTENIDHF